MRQEITVEEWEANFDEVFERVSDGETFVILDEKGNSFLLMPYEVYEDAST